ncbi:MAG: YbdK family carboxylate-amine ligase [Pirellulales bacterium]|nr:YbdK family carboxylate-amine ligase [Pirellulales bacterium]
MVKTNAQDSSPLPDVPHGGRIDFRSNTTPTLGVELEFGIVDANSMALTSAIEPLLNKLPDHVCDFVKPELIQSCVEVNTKVCATVAEAGQDLRGKIEAVEAACDELNLGLWWGATHPFSRCSDQEITPNERYRDLVDLLQEMARRLVSFGLHVHVGVDSGDKAIMICDRIMQHLPTLLAMTVSSPFFEGRATGLASIRSKIMEGLPTAGMPPLMRNWSEYVWLINHLVDTGFINTIREIWWDVRPHHNFGTVEIRICDMPGNLEDVLGVTALIQCLVKALSDMIDRGAYQHDCHPMMVRQNKWRAARYGNSAQLVDAFTHEVRDLNSVVTELVERLWPTAQELQCEEHLRHAVRITELPSWAERQETLLKETDDPAEVTRRLVQQSRLSIPT